MRIIFFSMSLFSCGRRKGRSHGDGWWAFNLSKASVEDFLPRRILCQPYGLSNSIVLVSAVRVVYIYLFPSYLLFFSDLNNFVVG